MSPFAFRTTLAGLSLAMLAALSACNGGGSDTTSTAGVGSGGTGYASGTVTGFGSVVVDGVTIDDRSAAVDVEVSPGVTGDGDVLSASGLKWKPTRMAWRNTFISWPR